jgi:hypothetical protein
MSSGVRRSAARSALAIGGGQSIAAAIGDPPNHISAMTNGIDRFLDAHTLRPR